jgi:hypothetical protein
MRCRATWVRKRIKYTARASIKLSDAIYYVVRIVRRQRL